MSYSTEDSEDVFAFLGVDIVRHPEGKVTLKQPGLTQKILNKTGMQDCNGEGTPTVLEPLGTDPEGASCTKTWEYASIVGMILYLSSNTRPDIQFAVHQCARFTHCPKKSHEEAILRICRYLQGTKHLGLQN